MSDTIAKKSADYRRNPSLMMMAQLIFWSRWLQAPLYLGLIVAQGVYVYQFMIELYHLVLGVSEHNEAKIMLIVLGLIDVVMIANLLIMVIIGGYETFVSRLNLREHPDQPQWLAHISATTMKIKLSMALIGISSIHLLKTFIDAEKMTEQTIKWQVIIHVTFLFSALAMALTDRIMSKTLLEAHGSADEL